jgi:sec-independent protein translocase protein TatA
VRLAVRGALFTQITGCGARFLTSFFRFHFDWRNNMFEGIFQPMHLMIIAGIALLVFGPKKLPELGKGMGEGIRGFKAAMQGKEEPKPLQPAAANATEKEA